MKWANALCASMCITFAQAHAAAACRETTDVVLGSPADATVCSQDEQVGVNVRGPFSTAKLPQGAALSDYRIYVFVHPVSSNEWYRQSPSLTRDGWIVRAYLGGRGQYSAKHNEAFELRAFASKKLSDRYDSDVTILKEPDTIELSPTKVVKVLRR